MRDLHLPGRSPVYAPNAAIATSHPLATQAGLEMLKSGGSAIDAAIAACAVLCVVEPHMTGIGGDCFALVAPGGADKPFALNGSGKAPMAAKLSWFQEQGITDLGLFGDPHTVTIPGAVAAWSALLERFGRKSFAEVLAPAIAYAEAGYPVAPRVHHDWSTAVEKLSGNAAAKANMLIDGRAPRIGERHAQPRLAATLRKIAEQGRDGFYKGAVAEDMVAALTALGGLHTLDDFLAAEAEWVEPISANYRGHDIYECPPNGQGICALMILKMLEKHDIASLSEADRVHLLAEATKLGYATRDRYVSDPKQVDVPVDWLLSDGHIAELGGLIDMEKAGSFAESDFPVHKDTIYLSCVDADGMAVSFINSLFSDFGSCIMAPESGVMLHNRGRSFQLKEGHANAIAPGKRPMHTIIPGMVVKDGRITAPFGVMGGQYQSTGHATFLTNVIDRGLDPQQALDDSRSFAVDGKLQVENTFAPETYETLKARGHDLLDMASPIGGGQAIWIDHEQGALIGASDPRKDGCAGGY